MVMEGLGGYSLPSIFVRRVHELLQTSPFITAPKAVEKTRLTMPTINAILDSLQRLGIIEEITGRKRGRVYAYRTYMNLLSEGVPANMTEKARNLITYQNITGG